jgi:PST family polysaccharide transporter
VRLDPDLVDAPERADATVIRSSGWVAVGYGGSHVLTLVTLLLLARLLDPGDFGVVALAWAILSPAMLLQAAGVGQALVHRRALDDVAAASAFVFTLASSLVLYGAAFGIAPLAARLFAAPELTDVMRVMALLLPLRALGTIALTVLERRIDFRGRAICELTAAIVRIAVSVALALAGAGVWALAIGHVAAAGALSVAGILLVRWLPDPRLASTEVLRELLGYGKFVSGANVLTVVNGATDNLVVGRLLGAGAVGIYTVAYRLATLPSTIVSQILRTAMFTVLCRLREDVAASRRVYFGNVQRIALLAAPIGVALIVAAKPIVLTLLGEPWADAVTPLRILAAYGLVKAVSASSNEVLKAFGLPSLAFAVAVFETALLVPLVVVLTIWLELPGAALGMLISASVAAVPALWLTLRTLAARPAELGRALAPCAVPAALLAAVLVAGETAPLALALAAGAAAYAAGAAFFARDVLRPVWAELRRGT